MKRVKLKVKNTIKRIIVAMMRSQQRRANQAILMALSDRELADIGIYRCDIPRIVAESKKK